VVVHASGAFAHGCALAEGIQVDTRRMRANVDLTRGLIVAEAVAVALAAHLGSGAAHAAVERAASTALEEKRPLLDVLAAKPAVTAYLDRDALAELLDPQRYTGEAGAVVDRVLARVARCPSPAKEKERP
jgi:3-carboxy-cis,cis-muconate cycloisomerase